MTVLHLCSAAYVQEIGRAGRDGELAEATLYYNNSDISTNTHVNDDMRQYCRLVTCRRQFILQHFGESAELDMIGHACCDNCRKLCM